MKSFKANQEPSSETLTKALRIFVVENHRDTLDSLKTYLESLGHIVVTAGSMNEALEKLLISKPEMLICDIGLPDGTGWELLKRANLPPHVFAVAMSGFGMSADGLRSRDVGFRHHLLKPFDLDEFDRILNEAVAAAD